MCLGLQKTIWIYNNECDLNLYRSIHFYRFSGKCLFGWKKSLGGVRYLASLLKPPEIEKFPDINKQCNFATYNML